MNGLMDFAKQKNRNNLPLLYKARFQAKKDRTLSLPESLFLMGLGFVCGVIWTLILVWIF